MFGSEYWTLTNQIRPGARHLGNREGEPAPPIRTLWRAELNISWYSGLPCRAGTYHALFVLAAAGGETMLQDEVKPHGATRSAVFPAGRQFLTTGSQVRDLFVFVRTSRVWYSKHPPLGGGGYQ